MSGEPSIFELASTARLANASVSSSDLISIRVSRGSRRIGGSALAPRRSSKRAFSSIDSELIGTVALDDSGAVQLLLGCRGSCSLTQAADAHIVGDDIAFDIGAPPTSAPCHGAFTRDFSNERHAGAQIEDVSPCCARRRGTTTASSPGAAIAAQLDVTGRSVSGEPSLDFPNISHSSASAFGSLTSDRIIDTVEAMAGARPTLPGGVAVLSRHCKIKSTPTSARRDQRRHLASNARPPDPSRSVTSIGNTPSIDVR